MRTIRQAAGWLCGVVVVLFAVSHAMATTYTWSNKGKVVLDAPNKQVFLRFNPPGTARLML